MNGESAASELVFVPLGGAGEIGMNLNLYGYGPAAARRWLMVDLGITFARAEGAGTDVIMPDPAFIVERRDCLDGLLLTHAHEDHLGAVPYLWPRLRCPVFGTRFALSVLRRKLAEAGLDTEVSLVEVDVGECFRIGPFDLELIRLTHSIPETSGVAIRTGAGTVMHTGDWKFDPDPVVGQVSDMDALNRVAGERVLALVGDSTNAFEPGESGSEAELLDSLDEIIGRCRKRVAVTCFASNVARLKTIAAAAARHGRVVVLAGASLKRFDATARECGLLDGEPRFVDEAVAEAVPADKMVIVCTGSQGEPTAALTRIANGQHARLSLGSGDTVVFSSRVIPGNEAAIGRLHNALLRAGVEIVTQRDAMVHVSGHPAREELVRMYQMIRPQAAVPVHGELRHLIQHAEIARACQVPEIVVAENGAVVRLAPGPAAVDGAVDVGRLALEGNRLVPIGGSLVRERNRVIYNGAVVVSVALRDGGDLVGEPQLTTIGLLEDEEDLARERVDKAVRDCVQDMTKSARLNDETARETIRIAVRRVFRELFDKNPRTHVHLLRL
jgi:ribonuclease J